MRKCFGLFMHLESKERDRKEGYMREVEESKVGSLWKLTFTVRRNGNKITTRTLGAFGV